MRNDVTTHTERQSNIELLRIVSMFFIVLEHVLLIGTDFFKDVGSEYAIVGNSIIGFTYIGVNCFILITGYFGADFSWNRLLSLYLICGFYEAVGFIVAYIQGDVTWSIEALSYIIFPLSHHVSWFIRCYVILLLLLPIINAGLQKLDKKKYVYALITLTVLNLYFGWFYKQANFNGDGYNASQMVYLYVIGRYLNKYVNWKDVAAYRKYILFAWIILSVTWGILQSINDVIGGIPHWNGWAYNNPIVVLSSIVFFAYFRCLNIPQSRVINVLGASMLAVFLIHMNRYVIDFRYVFGTIRKVIYSPLLSGSIWLQVVIMIGMALILLLMMAIVDIPRIKVHKWLLSKTNSFAHTHTHGASDR